MKVQANVPPIGELSCVCRHEEADIQLPCAWSATRVQRHHEPERS